MNLKDNAFTLIEILIVIAITSIFFGLTLANYNSFNQEKKLEKEASFLYDVLNLAKGKSQASDLNFTCPGGEEFAGYRVDVNASDYSFKQCCRNINTKIITTCGPSIQTYNFPSKLSKISGSSSIDFYPLSGGATAATIIIKNSSINKCLDITISTTGIITSGEDPIIC